MIIDRFWAIIKKSLLFRGKKKKKVGVKNWIEGKAAVGVYLLIPTHYVHYCLFFFLSFFLYGLLLLGIIIRPPPLMVSLEALPSVIYVLLHHAHSFIILNPIWWLLITDSTWFQCSTLALTLCLQMVLIWNLHFSDPKFWMEEILEGFSQIPTGSNNFGINKAIQNNIGIFWFDVTRRIQHIGIVKTKIPKGFP